MKDLFDTIGTRRAVAIPPAYDMSAETLLQLKDIAESGEPDALEDALWFAFHYGYQNGVSAERSTRATWTKKRKERQRVSFTGPAAFRDVPGAAERAGEGGDGKKAGTDTETAGESRTESGSGPERE